MSNKVKSKLIRKLFYRPQSFFVLNHATLQLRDKEVQRSVDESR